jgi:Holliday junction DNA helicase RuvA
LIGSLRGILAHKEPPFLVVEVGGVGYEVEAPMTTCFRLPAVGETVELLTHLLVREDHHTLFGFSTDAERRLFRHLLKVSGVGAKTALGVLSGMDVDAFIRAVESDDVASLIRLPGIGRKTAERIVIEMRDRVRQPGLAGSRSGDGRGVPGSLAPRDEALDALVALGYKAPEARRMLDQVPQTVASTEDLLRAVLRSAAPETS